MTTTQRLGAGGGGAGHHHSRSRFWQIDVLQPGPRIDLVCPQPRRLPLIIGSLNTPTPKHNGVLSLYRDDSACCDILDLILNTNDPDAHTDSSSQAGFFYGSPPVRTNNPVIHDPQFGKETPSFSPLGSSFGKIAAGRVEVGSPACGASSPKVRIEGFACGNKDAPSRTVTFV